MQYLLEIHVSYVLLSCTVFLLSLTVRNLATVGCWSQFTVQMDLNVIESRSFMVTNDAQQTAVWLVNTRKQMVQSNFTASSFGPPGHGQFSRVRQLATLGITCFLWLTPVHNTNGISSGSAILHSSRLSVIGHAEICFSPKIAPSHRGCWPSSNTCFLWPTRVYNPNSISIGSTVLQGSSGMLYSLKIAIFHRRIWTWFL